MMCRRSGFVLTLWMALVLGSPRTDAQVGTVLDEHKISALEGGFAVDLEEDAYFGACIASLGDLNGDGTDPMQALLSKSTMPSGRWM